MYTVLASRRARYDFVVVEKHLCLICALYWILQQGSQSDCGPLQSTGEAIGSIAQQIDPTFQKIWMCSMPNEFSRTAVIWTYLYFNRSELKITEAKCLIVLTGNVDGLPFLSNARDIWFLTGEKWIIGIGGVKSPFSENIIGFQITTVENCTKY